MAIRESNFPVPGRAVDAGPLAADLELGEQVFRMRARFMSIEQIAEELKIGRARAVYLERIGMRQAVERSAERSTGLKELMLARLEQLLTALTPGISSGKEMAIREARNIIQMIVNLYGLAEPQQIESVRYNVDIAAPGMSDRLERIKNVLELMRQNGIEVNGNNSKPEILELEPPRNEPE